MITNQDSWFDLSRVTLGEVLKHSKRIFMVSSNIDDPVNGIFPRG